MFRLSVFFLLIGVALGMPSGTQAQSLSQLQEQLLVLIQQVTQLQSNLNTLQKISYLPCSTLSRNMGLGDQGDDVAFLQVSLKREGFSLGKEENTHVYGEMTASAVTGFQQKYQSEILTPLGLKYGTGYVGNGTRAKLNSIYGCGAKAPDLSNQRPQVRSLKHLTILTPSGGQAVTSSIHISGYVNSDGWITNRTNVGTVSLFDTLGRLLAQTSLSTKGDLDKMPIAFEGDISFSSPQVKTGYLTFLSQNTSTFLPTADKEFRLPVKFAAKGGGAVTVLTPQLNSQLIAGEPFTFLWQNTSTVAVNLYLIDTAQEALGSGQAVRWKAENAANDGSYKLTLPLGLTGNYRLHMTAANGYGTSAIFSIYSRAQVASKPPVVASVTGPTSLRINEKGTWQVRASDPEKGNLTFSVLWGDGSSGLPGISSLTDAGDWMANFENHSYGLTHNYTLTFIVTDNQGLNAQKTYVVNVVP